MKILLPILLLLSISSHANDSIETCADLARNCAGVTLDASTTDNNFNTGHCVGFIKGMIYGDAGRWIAIPEGVTPLQFVNVVKKYLRENPEQWHKPMGFCVWDAFTDAGWLKK